MARRSTVVLVVDDNPFVRATAVEMFQSLGLVVHDAYNAQDALRLLRDHPEIAILFADVRMPGMKGDELAQEALRVRPDLKVVLTSAYMAQPPVPGLPFLRKPWRIEEFAGVISSATERSH